MLAMMKVVLSIPNTTMAINTLLLTEKEVAKKLFLFCFLSLDDTESTAAHTTKFSQTVLALSLQCCFCNLLKMYTEIVGYGNRLWCILKLQGGGWTVRKTKGLS